MGFSFALFTSDPNLLECEVRRLSAQVALPDDDRLNAAAVGSYAQDQVLLRRFRSGALPRALTELLPNSHSEALVYHAEALPVGASVEDTQPFRFRNWLFCQGGEVRGYAALRPQLVAELPGFLQTQLRGESPAEGAFLLFLKHLRELAPLDERRLDLKRVAQTLLKTARRLQELSSHAGAPRISDFSLVATNQELLVATRAGAQALFYTLLEGSDRCEVCGTAPAYAVPQLKLRAHLQRRTVAVASQARGGGWIEVADGQAIAIDTRGGIERV